MPLNLHALAEIDPEAERLGPNLTAALEKYIDESRKGVERFEAAMLLDPSLRAGYEAECAKQGISPY